MSVSEAEYRYALESIVTGLKAIGGSDMASVQINSDGRCILRSGVLHTEHMSVGEFALEIARAVAADLED